MIQLSRTGRYSLRDNLTIIVKHNWDAEDARQTSRSQVQTFPVGSPPSCFCHCQAYHAWTYQNTNSVFWLLKSCSDVECHVSPQADLTIQGTAAGHGQLSVMSFQKPKHSLTSDVPLPISNNVCDLIEEWTSNVLPRNIHKVAPATQAKDKSNNH